VLRFKNLGSGSAGNATVVEARCGAQVSRLLIDCGLSVKELSKRLGQADLMLEDLDAVFVTHEHADHIGHTHQLAKRTALPVWMSRGTALASGVMGWGLPSDQLLLVRSGDGDHHTFELTRLQQEHAGSHEIGNVVRVVPAAQRFDDLKLQPRYPEKISSLPSVLTSVRTLTSIAISSPCAPRALSRRVFEQAHKPALRAVWTSPAPGFEPLHLRRTQGSPMAQARTPKTALFFTQASARRQSRRRLR
jgi:hypothetical protein